MSVRTSLETLSVSELGGSNCFGVRAEGGRGAGGAGRLTATEGDEEVRLIPPSPSGVDPLDTDADLK